MIGRVMQPPSNTPFSPICTFHLEVRGSLGALNGQRLDLEGKSHPAGILFLYKEYCGDVTKQYMEVLQKESLGRLSCNCGSHLRSVLHESLPLWVRC